jgi:hypothetical protein
MDMGCATARRATLAKSPSTIPIPAANQAAIISTPCRTGLQEIPILPGTRHRRQEDSPSWYFRGVPLGRDLFPGTSGPEEARSEEKSIGGPGATAAR